MGIELIGNRTEQEYLTELLSSREIFFGEKSDSRLKQVLISNGYDATKAIVIGSIPDQGEDIYSVLILPDLVISVEIDRIDDTVEPTIETISLESYHRRLSKINQIKLAVALNILNKSWQNRVARGLNSPRSHTTGHTGPYHGGSEETVTGD